MKFMYCGYFNVISFSGKAQCIRHLWECAFPGAFTIYIYCWRYVEGHGEIYEEKQGWTAGMKL